MMILGWVISGTDGWLWGSHINKTPTTQRACQYERSRVLKGAGDWRTLCLNLAIRLELILQRWRQVVEFTFHAVATHTTDIGSVAREDSDYPVR